MNQLYQVEITDLAFGGEGVGRIENMVCFIPFTAPGDIVQVEITQRKKKFLRGRAAALTAPSPLRVEPPCPYFGLCGGCQWQHIDYAQQLESKRSHLQHILRKSAGIEYPVPAPLPSPQIFEYRRSARLKVNIAGEVGFFREQSNTVVPIEHCMVLEPVLNEEIPAIKAEIEAKLTAADAMAPPILPLEVELSSENGEAATHDFLYQGEPSKQGFLQANRGVNRLLQSFIHQHIDALTEKDDTVLDLFCGDGNLSLPLAASGVHVLGYDISGLAIKKARRAAAEIYTGKNSAGSCSYRREPFQKIMNRVAEKAPEIRAAILDPPRQGLAGKAGAIAALGFPMVLYISCIPAILARDLLFFIKAGYEIREIQPMDMFPHTYHLETAVALTLPLDT
ncbi:MAG: class I SAM-dependent RNA methyltransferase [Spirochaetota bacterium]